MSDYVCIDVDKLISALPRLINEISADDKCGSEAVESPDVPAVPSTSAKQIVPLVDYLWEDSDELNPGKAFLMPQAPFTRKIVRASVNSEELEFHSVWRNGREIWFADHGVAHYGNGVLEIETESTIYRTGSGEHVKPLTDGEEQLRYHGRHNGDRPTWYGSKKMKEYPKTIRIVIPGCVDKVISNNGSRYDDGVLIVKQSDVSGRGVAVIYSSSCNAKVARLVY